MRKVLFLDRDGTINVDKHYLCHPDQFEWIPGIVPLCQGVLSHGYEIIVITNQSGIARGYYTEEEYQVFTRFMISQFALHQIVLLGVFHCPDLESPDRKPEPGMFLKAARQYQINMLASLSLGDKERDVIAASRAGVGFNCLLSPNTIPPHTLAHAVLRRPDDMLKFLPEARCCL